MIDGLAIRPLDKIAGQSGSILKMLHADAADYSGFGEVYFSRINPGVVKGWHKHRRTTSYYAVPFGRIRLVVYDDRPASPTKGELQAFELGPDSYNLAVVPPGIWNGFKGEGDLTSLIAICVDQVHEANEIERMSPRDNSIPYDWGI